MCREGAWTELTVPVTLMLAIQSRTCDFLVFRDLYFFAQKELMVECGLNI